jgi:hypothetical protein
MMATKHFPASALKVFLETCVKLKDRMTVTRILAKMVDSAPMEMLLFSATVERLDSLVQIAGFTI